MFTTPCCVMFTTVSQIIITTQFLQCRLIQQACTQTTCDTQGSATVHVELWAMGEFSPHPTYSPFPQKFLEPILAIGLATVLCKLVGTVKVEA